MSVWPTTLSSVLPYLFTMPEMVSRVRVEAGLDLVRVHLEGRLAGHAHQELVIGQTLHPDGTGGDLIRQGLLEVLALLLHVGPHHAAGQGPADGTDQGTATRVGAEGPDGRPKGGPGGGADGGTLTGLGHGAVGGTAGNQDADSRGDGDTLGETSIHGGSSQGMVGLGRTPPGDPGGGTGVRCAMIPNAGGANPGPNLAP